MTTFGLKAGCGRLIEYDNADDLATLYESGMLADVLPIGSGSNMLLSVRATTGRYFTAALPTWNFPLPTPKAAWSAPQQPA